jgi:hypothetical protein
MRIRIGDPGIFLIRAPGTEKFRSEIRDKHPGSATLQKTDFCSRPSLISADLGHEWPIPIRVRPDV